MSLGTLTRKQTGKTKTRSNSASILNQFAYVLIGLVFGGMLTLSAMNDYLFFEWLAMGSFIVFALVGIHIIGINQTKRN